MFTVWQGLSRYVTYAHLISKTYIWTLVFNSGFRFQAWFRELPTSVLDSLSPEQVMQCQTEEENVELVRLLPPTEAALLDWAINLMADVVQYEHLNKMNSRNIAMVFAPNMTQVSLQQQGWLSMFNSGSDGIKWLRNTCIVDGWSTDSTDVCGSSDELSQDTNRKNFKRKARLSGRASSCIPFRTVWWEWSPKPFTIFGF